MRKECRVTVTTLSFSENTGDIFFMKSSKIDPAYLSWVAYKFTPKIPKQERFVKIAQAYHSIHLDIMIRKSREKRSSSRYLGELGEKLTDLKLKVTRVRLEDDPYKTRVNGTTPQFFVKQVLTLTDASGNLVTMSIPSKNPSAVSCTLSGIEHEYRLGRYYLRCIGESIAPIRKLWFKSTRALAM